MPVHKADGRIIATCIKAPINVPGFKRAAMDGYAVVAEDTFGAARTKSKNLQLIGKIFTGEKPTFQIESGKCVQISTGAPMPLGADAVVMVEETSIKQDNVSIYKPVYPGANVSLPDSDIKKDTNILDSNTILSPPKIGVLAALGFNKVKVYKKPKVIIFPTGDEIVLPGNNLDFGKIYDINSYTLASLLEKAGAEANINTIAGDTKKDLSNCIDKANGYDYAIFSGGSSVGERDLLHEVLAEKGKLLFHGIALKPGKPTICGIVDETLVFGMPGYPTSCLTNAYVLLEPSIKKMARLPYNPKKEKAILSHNITSTIGRHQIYTVKVENGIAKPVFKESGAITSMSMASGYIEIPANVEYLEKETEVIVNFF